VQCRQRRLQTLVTSRGQARAGVVAAGGPSDAGRARVLVADGRAARGRDRAMKRPSNPRRIRCEWPPDEVFLAQF
jgi:hypothetical protein